MTESDNKFSGHYQRVVFPRGEQNDFLDKVQSKLKLSIREFAKIAGICVRSMTDWKREKFSISLPALKKLCQKARIPLPKNIRIKNPFWYVYRGGKVGGSVVYKKYGRIGGNPEYRKKRWYEWWERVGRFNPNKYFVAKEITLPQKNTELAEFIGIILGDGGISSSQVTITLNKFSDRYFINYIKKLFYKLFRIRPAIYKRKREKVASIVASRSELVKFLVDIGLKIGGKVRQQVEVPHWIEESQSFIKACLKGLFDTDGCFYTDRHLYKDKTYFNCGMNFTNRSLPILNFFKINLKKFGLHPTQKTEFSIFLRKEKDIIQYFKEIGSSNPKHLNKFKKYFKNRYGGVPKWS